MKFGKEELKKGTDREMEHTDSRKEAAKIAKDHLNEKPDYYTKLDKCIPEETVNEADEHVTIHSPGHRYHGKKARVFHKHDDGRINVQIRHSQKKGDVNNLTLDKGQWKPLHEATLGGSERIGKDNPNNSKLKGPGVDKRAKDAAHKHDKLSFGQAYRGGVAITKAHMGKDVDSNKKIHADAGHKMKRHQQAIDAAKKVGNVKEENIQELSKDTMKNYRKKALIDAALARKGSERAFDNDDIENSNKLNKIKHKRYKGAAMADKKLKEETVKEGVNGEHGPGDDEDSLDRIERKKMEKSRKAAAKVKAIKMAANKK